MATDKTDAGWLWDMMMAAQAVEQFVHGQTLPDYEADLMLRSAVERQIEIIGEAARHVSDDFQEAHPEISWKPIMAQRHVLAHDYGEIKHDLVWRVATVHIPELIKLLAPLVPSPPSDEGASDSPG